MPERTSLSRRTLLKGAAALAAPYFVPASALRQGRVEAAERADHGRLHRHRQHGRRPPRRLPGRQGSVQVVAVCDVDAVKREKAKKQVEEKYAADRQAGDVQGLRRVQRLRRLLDRPDIDAVLIATPDHWHAIIAIAAARAGKDIYCEKPLTLTIREARAMVAGGPALRPGLPDRQPAAQREQLPPGLRAGPQRADRQAAEGQRRRRRAVVGGVPARGARAARGSTGTAGSGRPRGGRTTHERCSGDYGGGWRRIRDYSGGMMTDWGAHHFDIAQWGLGMDGSGPVEIIPPKAPTAFGQMPDPDEGEGLVYKYANGVPMYHGGRQRHPLHRHRGQDRGQPRLPPAPGPTRSAEEPLGPNDVHLYESPGHGRTGSTASARGSGRSATWRSGRARSPSATWATSPTGWAGRSSGTRTSSEIIGDDEASRWLDRPKRAPWRTYL